MNIKKIIAREGLIFIGLVLIVCIGACLQADVNYLIEDTRDFLVEMLPLFCLIYLIIRFIHWAIKTLKKKD